MQATEPLRDADAYSEHARFFSQSLDCLCFQLVVPESTLCWWVSRIYFSCSEPAMVKQPAGGVEQEAGEDWDGEGHIQMFRTGQNAVAVVVPGDGLCNVVAPVRCTL